jgi:hypothetical protein
VTAEDQPLDPPCTCRDRLIDWRARTMTHPSVGCPHGGRTTRLDRAASQRVDVRALAAELGPFDVAAVAERAGLSVGTVRDVIDGRLKPEPWIRDRLANALGLRR